MNKAKIRWYKWWTKHFRKFRCIDCQPPTIHRGLKRAEAHTAQHEFQRNRRGRRALRKNRAISLRPSTRRKNRGKAPAERGIK